MNQTDDKQSPSTACRADGRCQYAIDHGAEGLGHCPVGECVQPSDPADIYEEEYTTQSSVGGTHEHSHRAALAAVVAAISARSATAPHDDALEDDIRDALDRIDDTGYGAMHADLLRRCLSAVTETVPLPQGVADMIRNQQDAGADLIRAAHAVAKEEGTPLAEERRSEVNVFERLNRRGIAMPIGLRSRLQEWAENLRPESKHADDAFFLIFLLDELLPPSDGTTSPHGPHGE